MVTFQKYEPLTLVCPECKQEIGNIVKVNEKATVEQIMYHSEIGFLEKGWDASVLIIKTPGKITYRCPKCGYNATKKEEYKTQKAKPKPEQKITKEVDTDEDSDE